MFEPVLYQYQAGGSLPLDAPTYVKRQADDALYQALRSGEFCYILNARQMGKSSLRVRMMDRLQRDGVRSGMIDMTTIGSQQITTEQWYASLLQSIVKSFGLSVNLRSWWREQSYLSPVKRFGEFLETVLLVEVVQPIVIFIDEIDSVLGLTFPVDDFFALIRAYYNQRSENPIYQRLTFALLGVATPGDLIADKTRTPFNIGCAIELQGFRLSEALPLLPGLQSVVQQPEVMLRHVLEWTDGQPFLTQKICQLILKAWEQGTIAILPGEEASWLENLLRSHLIHHWELQDEPEHLRTIAHRLLHDEQRAGRLLGLYQQILKSPGTAIPLDNRPEQTELLLSGLVVKDQGYLRVRNRIYAAVFNQEWVEQQLTQLRPYAINLKEWLKSGQRDQSRLLQGQALQEAEIWAEGKRIGDQDYQFLAACRALEQREQQQSLEAARTREVEARLVQEKKTAQLQRYLLRVVSLALVVAIAFGLVAFWQYRGAAISEIQAISRVSEALFVSNRRLDALVEALRAQKHLHQVIAVDANTRKQTNAVLQQAVYNVVEYNRLTGHQEFVYSVAISPDGQCIATASRDKTVKLWSPEGRLLQTLQGHRDQVIDVAFSPDGQRLVTGDDGGTVKLWSKSGQLIRTWKGHESTVSQVAFSPNDQLLASASFDNTIKLWRLNGTLIRKMSAKDSVLGLDFSSDGDTIAAATVGGTVQLWTVQGRLLHAWKGHQNAINAVAFSPDGTLLASAGSDRMIKLWRRDGQLIRTIEGFTSQIQGVSFSPNGQWLASTGGDQMVRIWNLDGTLMLTLNQEEFSWNAVFSPDGTWLASAGSNNLVKLWRLNHPLLTHLRGHQNFVMQTNFSPDGERLASASWDGTVKLWTRSGKLLTTFKEHQNRVFAVAFHPNGQRLATADANDLIKLWQPNGTVLNTFSLVPPQVGKLLTPTQQVRAEAGGIDFSPDGQLLAAGNSAIAQAKVWRLDGTLVATLVGHRRGISRIRFSPDGQRLATASWDGTVKLWALDGTLLQSFKAHQSEVQDVVFSPDGKWLASAGHDRTVKLWSIDGKLLQTFTGHDSKVYGVAFSPDGKMIASGSRDRTIKLWQLDGTLLATLKAHDNAIYSVAFSPDGQQIASASWDGTVILWDLQRAIDLPRLEQIGCDWIQDYLHHNPAERADLDCNKADR